MLSILSCQYVHVLECLCDIYNVGFCSIPSNLFNFHSVFWCRIRMWVVIGRPIYCFLWILTLWANTVLNVGIFLFSINLFHNIQIAILCV